MTDRIKFIDRARGFAILLMLLDHARYFLVQTGYHPLNALKTDFFLFFTRWCTHLAAPLFVFLAGVSVFLKLEKSRNRAAVSRYLLFRGFVLLLLEITVVGFLWRLRIDALLTFQVIAAIGCGFLFLSVMLYLPKRVIFILGCCILIGHNLLDSVPYGEYPSEDILRKILFIYSEIDLGGDISLRIVYPFLPWFGILLLGYGSGTAFLADRDKFSRSLLKLGPALLGGFIILRIVNRYGNFYKWIEYPSLDSAFFSFLNCSKYPPSLVFTLLTGGLISLLFVLLIRTKGRFTRSLGDCGREPLFNYLAHLVLLQVSSAFLFLIFTGRMVWNLPAHSSLPGFPLYTAWLAAAALYPLIVFLSRFYSARKSRKCGRI